MPAGIAIIIPTYNRSTTLMQALTSLQQQTLDDFDILVVDNAADPQVEQSIVQFNQMARIPAHYVAEPNLGLHNARHAGANAATRDILMFTDDDATFDPGCLKAYVETFATHPDMVAAGGTIRPVWENPPPQWLVDFIGNDTIFGILSLMDPFSTFQLDTRGSFYGVNMTIRRNILFEVGGFNPEAFGDTWLGDGESGLRGKLWERDMLIGYVPDALVYHHIPQSRMTLDYFSRRMSNQGACDGYTKFHGTLMEPMALLRHIAWTVRELLLVFVKAPYRIVARQDRLALIRARFDSTYYWSHLRYIVRLLHDREFRGLVMKENWLTGESG